MTFGGATKYFVFVIALLLAPMLVSADIELTVTSDKPSDTVDHLESTTVDFTISHTNTICSLTCEYGLIDDSKGEMVEYSTITIGTSGTKSATIPITIRAPSKSEGGIEGQVQYTFGAECEETSPLCFDDPDDEYTHFTLNYKLSSAEQAAKDFLDANLNSLGLELATLETVLHNSRSRIEELPNNVLISDLESELSRLERVFDSVKSNHDRVTSLYDSLDFLGGQTQFSTSWVTQVTDASRDQGTLDGQITSRVERHNKVQTRILESSTSLNELSRRATVVDLVENFQSIKQEISEISTKFERGMFGSYDEIERDVLSIERQINSLDNSIKERERLIIEELHQIIHAELGKVCEDLNSCEFSLGLNENAPVDEYIRTYCDDAIPSLEKYFGEINTKRINQFQETKSSVETRNVVLSTINEKIVKINSLREELFELSNKNSYEIEENCVEIPVIESVEQANYFEQVCQEQLVKAKEYVAEKETGFFYKFTRFFKNVFTRNQYKYEPMPQKDLIPIPEEPATISFSNEFVSTAESYCELDLESTPKSTVSAKYVSNPEGETLSGTSVNAATEHESQCCVFGECRKCCEGDECRSDVNSYPIIFLHGHSFKAWDSPEYSLDAFNKIREELFEDGIIYAGIITPSSSQTSVDRGDWGKSGKPVSIKTTYYYGVYNEDGQMVDNPSKSENITKYASRLKDTIDLIKYRTNRDKVIIIAHSMGGLVSREYIRVYGSDSVYKLIMVATPNHGIYGSADLGCEIFGADIECKEMEHDSDFIGRLNEDETPGQTEYYTITGTGCETNVDGDGIVRTTSVPVEGGTNYDVSGKCEGWNGKDFHSNLLDPSKYPDTMKYIRKALAE